MEIGIHRVVFLIITEVASPLVLAIQEKPMSAPSLTMPMATATSRLTAGELVIMPEKFILQILKMRHTEFEYFPRETYSSNNGPVPGNKVSNYFINKQSSIEGPSKHEK